MSDVIAPKERHCERCGRRDIWDSDVDEWRIATDEDGARQTGQAHCLHEWDINGTFNPVRSRGQ
jgi:hypothetical protein